jgi:uncharacterized membrane protein HdeD (DUF308 family)
VAILFGIVALAWPGLTLIGLVWLFGAFVLAFGVVQLIGMYRAIRAHTTWWPYLLVGVVSLVAGMYVLLSPLITSAALGIAIAIWAVVVGSVEAVTGINRSDLLRVALGVITVLFGLVIFGRPVAGAMALVWVIGVFAIVRGILLLVGAFRAPAGGGAPTPS